METQKRLVCSQCQLNVPSQGLRGYRMVEEYLIVVLIGMADGAAWADTKSRYHPKLLIKCVYRRS